MPQPGGHFTHAEASYNSVFGKVKSKWEKADGKTTYSIMVPANRTAEIVLPGGTKQTIGVGVYTFTED